MLLIVGQLAVRWNGVVQNQNIGRGEGVQQVALTGAIVADPVAESGNEGLAVLIDDGKALPDRRLAAPINKCVFPVPTRPLAMMPSPAATRSAM